MNPAEVTDQTRTRKPNVFVPKNKAEKTIELLARSELIDKNFNFKRDDRTLSLPLVRPLKPSELDLLKSEVVEVRFGDDSFEPRKKAVQNLVEALSNEIPANLLSELPRSYDIVGDIVVLELDPDLRKYENNVAHAILTVHRNVRAVFARAGAISGIERVRPLRHIAGENRTETIHREFGCSFKVNLSQAFFTPRLSTEHQRVANQVVDGEHVVDMFAGVGPFSILIAKNVKNVTVDAIDSNQAAASLIEENARLNKVASKVQVYSCDARKIVRDELSNRATRVVMNHPSESREFIDAACDALRRSGGIIHYYTFAHGNNPESSAGDEFDHALKRLPYSISGRFATHRVREVAPSKWQVAIDVMIKPS